VCNLIQTPSFNEGTLPGSSHHLKVTPHRNTSGRVEGYMPDSQRYRDNAAECLLAAQEAREPHYRRLHLSMALSWLSLARHDEALAGPSSDTGQGLD
jgi:hypothetical protein